MDADLRDRMLAGQTSMESGKMERALQHADGGLKGILEIFQRMIPQNLFKLKKFKKIIFLVNCVNLVIVKNTSSMFNNEN